VSPDADFMLRLVAPDGTISTLAGDLGVRGVGSSADDGVGTAAKFTSYLFNLCLSNDQSQCCLSLLLKLLVESLDQQCCCVCFADTLYVIDYDGLSLWPAAAAARQPTPSF
jgi:hypothetical protein